MGCKNSVTAGVVFESIERPSAPVLDSSKFPPKKCRISASVGDCGVGGSRSTIAMMNGPMPGLITLPLDWIPKTGEIAVSIVA